MYFTAGNRRGEPSWVASCWSDVSEGSGGAPNPLFLSEEAAPHHLPRRKVVTAVCTFSFKLTSGLDLVRMEQGNPRVWLAVMGFVHVKTKSSSKSLKKKKTLL